MFLLGCQSFLWLKIRNERLVIGPDGLRYFNIFGKLKLSSTVPEIYGIQLKRYGRYFIYVVNTENGDVPINGFQKAPEIKKQVMKITGRDIFNTF